MTLHYYSPAAYEFVRTIFDKHLPHIRTIQSWYSTIQASPGITKIALETLHEKVQNMKSEGKELSVSMIIDEMAIRKKLQWDPYKKEFDGFISCGNVKSTDNGIPVASYALVFLVVGDDFKIPVAYHLVNGIDAKERELLIHDIIVEIQETGVKIESITFDGLISNIASGRILGADFDNDKPFFPCPTFPGRLIYIILDAAHMLKLARNCIASKQLFLDGRPIKWKLIENLVEKQSKDNINTGNKLTQKHIHYKDRIMNVRIAAETLSRSVVNSLQQLDSDGVTGFDGSAATREFILLFDTLFDTMNTKEGHEGRNYKQPISGITKDEIFNFYAYAKQRLKQITIKELVNGNIVNRSVFQSKSFTPFFGFYHNMISIEHLYNDCVVNGPLEKLYTFKYSQDHLETWFGCVRRMHGCNDNPTVQQFVSSYRRLLVFNGIQCSKHSNCFNDTTKILTVSSRIVNNPENATRTLSPIERDDSNEPNGLLNWDNSGEAVDTYITNKWAYLASVLEIEIMKTMTRCHKKSCYDCTKVFHENEVMTNSFIDLINKTKDVPLPCKSTFDIVKTAEETLQSFQAKPVGFQDSVFTVLANLNLNDLYELSEFDDHENCNTSNPISHKQIFVCSIIEAYLSMKSKYIGDRITMQKQGEYIRHKLLKEVHRNGQ